MAGKQELYEEGELLKFLPSDIFPVDQQQQPHVSSSLSFSNSNQPNHSNHNNYNYSYSNVDRHFSCMGAHNRLSQGLAASFSFIRLTTPPPQSFFVMPPPNLELHRLAHHRVSSVTLPDLCTCGGCIRGANQIRVCGAGVGVGVDWNSYGPVHSFHEMNSVQPQAECFMEGRAMGLQGMQYHGWAADRLMEKPILPFHGGGFVGGTGVYLPRVPASISSTTANHIDDYRRRRQGARKRRDDEAQFLPGAGRNSVKNTDHKKKQEDCLSQVSPEMGLPEDWTY